MILLREEDEATGVEVRDSWPGGGQDSCCSSKDRQQQELQHQQH